LCCVVLCRVCVSCLCVVYVSCVCVVCMCRVYVRVTGSGEGLCAGVRSVDGTRTVHGTRVRSCINFVLMIHYI